MKKLLLFFLVLIFSLSSGCIEKKTNPVAADAKGKTYLIYSIENFPEDLLQLSSGSNRDKDFLISLFEGLVKTDENGKVIPGLAESWTQGKDNITYTFKLREEAKWSDGKNITANDFVTFFRDILSSKVNNNYANQLYYIFGAEDYNKGKKSFSGVAIRAVDDRTLEIRLNAPSSCFLQILSQPIYTLRKIDASLKDWKSAYSNIGYTGPFKLQNISEDGELLLARNENYYDNEEVKLDKFYVICIPGIENEMANFKTGKINFFLDPPSSENRNLILNGEEETVAIASGISINFNLKKPGIAKDINFRRAISLSVDREEIVNQDSNSLTRTALAYLPVVDGSDGSFSKDSEFVKENKDITKAKNSLIASKYDKKEKLKFIYQNSSQNKKIIDALTKDLKVGLDLNIDVEGLSKLEFEDAIKGGNYSMFLGEYSYNYNHPLSVLENWLSNSKANISGYNSSQFDGFIAKAKIEADSKKGTDLLQKGEQQLISDMPAIPLCFQNVILCKKLNIKGVYVTKEGNIRLDKAFIDNSNTKS